MKLNGFRLPLTVAFILIAVVQANEATETKCDATDPESLVACDTPRDLVVIFEESVNTRFAFTRLHSPRKALKSLRLGVARFLQTTSGRCATPYRVHLKRFANKPTTLVNVSISTEPNEILDAFAFIEQNPLESDPCYDDCCCSSTFFNFFPTLVNDYTAAIYFIVLDCFLKPSAAVIDDLRGKLWTSRVIFIKLADSYCRQTGGDAFTISFTDTMFTAKSSEIGNISNPIGAKTRAIGIVMYEGDLNVLPRFEDPNGNSCGDGWTSINGRCYQVQSRASTWMEASSSCRRQGAILLNVFEPSDNVLEHPEILRQLAIGKSEVQRPVSFWLGLHDTGASEQFQWDFLRGFAPLSSINYTNWDHGQPSNMIPESKRCVVVDVVTGKWRTSLCQALLKSICVRPQYMFDFVDASEEPVYMQVGYWDAYLDSYTRCTANYYLLK